MKLRGVVDLQSLFMGLCIPLDRCNEIGPINDKDFKTQEKQKRCIFELTNMHSSSCTGRTQYFHES